MNERDLAILLHEKRIGCARSRVGYCEAPHEENAASILAATKAPTPSDAPDVRGDNQAALESLPDAVQAVDFNLPPRVIVCEHGHYWRDYGDFLSMCPVSEDNLACSPQTVYTLAPTPPDALEYGGALYNAPTPTDALREAAQAVTGRRLFDLGDKADHEWLAGYFSGWHGVPMLRNSVRQFAEELIAEIGSMMAMPSDTKSATESRRGAYDDVLAVISDRLVTLAPTPPDACPSCGVEGLPPLVCEHCGHRWYGPTWAGWTR